MIKREQSFFLLLLKLPVAHVDRATRSFESTFGRWPISNYGSLCLQYSVNSLWKSAWVLQLKKITLSIALCSYALWQGFFLIPTKWIFKLLAGTELRRYACRLLYNLYLALPLHPTIKNFYSLLNMVSF